MILFTTTLTVSRSYSYSIASLQKICYFAVMATEGIVGFMII